MKRREFLKHGLGFGAWMVAGGGIMASAIHYGRSAWANGTQKRALPIPTLLEPQNDRPVELTMQSGLWEILPGVKTPTWGFNGPYLGPTVRMRQGQDVPFIYRNNLTEAIAVHGHGLHVPGEVDGGPQQEIAPGDHWAPVLPIRQQACTSWYHPHTHGKTGKQVYHGLAGFMIIDDENSDDLPLPSTYGVDDIPVVVQDRILDRRGRLVYSLEDADEEDGFLGETVTVNGITDPVARVPAGLVRLRMLNGSNARFYRFRFDDDRTFHKIATDGGFLESPVPVNELIMLPGERNEIIVDFSDGRPAMLTSGPKEPTNWWDFDDDRDRNRNRNRDRNYWAGGMNDVFQILEFQVDPNLPVFNTPLPGQMNQIQRPSMQTRWPIRRFELNMDMDDDDRRGRRWERGRRRERNRMQSSNTHSMMMQSSSGHSMMMNMSMGINGQMMDMGVINERVKIGQWERWRVSNDDSDHPFHVHGCSFLVLSQDGKSVSEENAGWKDTVWVNDSAEFLVRFDYEATEQHPYMYHCHILEHEDMGMMGQFTVT